MVYYQYTYKKKSYLPIVSYLRVTIISNDSFIFAAFFYYGKYILTFLKIVFLDALILPSVHTR